ncbi:stress-response A/B barrel domain-containing protein UP3-like [Magnolia sinica]|uniref:stress-response A/B barrel domain-containing protein UP3-like n=1 Tax=Magnolia sinica TaxID=86752 RepID=UPI0026587588|nr:stress-response A/B barrel domain-containing protein UP3-like [Magnolia sinica]
MLSLLTTRPLKPLFSHFTHSLPKLPLPKLQIPKIPFSPSPFKPLPSLSLSHTRPEPASSSRLFSSVKMASKTIEHIVLFRVKPDTHPSKLDTMISRLNGLTSLPSVLHLTAGPISKNRSQSFDFTHLLHSRYKTKEDLASYSAEPAHVSVVKESVLPICDDVMGFDWVSDLDGPISPRPGSAMRITLLKLKEGLGDGEKGEILTVLGGIKASFPEIDQISFGENFSPARAKGFTVGSVSIFPGVKEMDGLDEKGQMVEMEKEKVRSLLESVIVLDYEIPLPTAASL